MKKLAFIGNSEPPAKLLRLFSKFTPNRSEIWGELKGVDNYKDADYFAVIDVLPDHLRSQVDERKCVFLGAHPESMHAYQDMSKFNGIKMYDCRHIFGYGEWWLKYDYDYLMGLQPPNKINDLCCIMSDANSQIYHKIRRNYIEKFCHNHPNKLNLHGRIKPWGILKEAYKGRCGSNNESADNGNDHMSGKEEVYANHKYAIEFDAIGENYFSERIFDCLLMWCMPLYWGGKNLHKYIPKESFSYLSLNSYGNDVRDVIDSNIYEKALPLIAEARQILLNKLQIWPRTHEAIFGRCV